MKWIYRIVFLAVIFVAIFFLIPTVWSMIIADPLPQAVRTKFNVIGHIGKTARSSKAYVGFGASPQSVQEIYDHIKDKFDALIDKAVEGLTLNRVDEQFLDAELSSLLVLAARFRKRDDYNPIGDWHPRSCDTPEKVKQTLELFTDFANSAMRDWRGLVLKREELRKATVEQLKSSRWPSWGERNS